MTDAVLVAPASSGQENYLSDGHTPARPGSRPPTTSASPSLYGSRSPCSSSSAASRSALDPLRTPDARRATSLTDDAYNKLFTLHGVVMVWFFLIPSIPTTLRQLPAAADDRRARTWLSRGSICSAGIFNIAGGLFTLYAVIAGGVDTGWTFYTPYSTMFSNSHVLAAAAGVFIAGFSSIADRASISSSPSTCCARRA